MYDELFAQRSVNDVKRLMHDGKKKLENGTE